MEAEAAAAGRRILSELCEAGPGGGTLRGILPAEWTRRKTGELVQQLVRTAAVAEDGRERGRDRDAREAREGQTGFDRFRGRAFGFVELVLGRWKVHKQSVRGKAAAGVGEIKREQAGLSGTHRGG